uniref:Uncharacterized protein n=1 Tax=Mycena chlorophos TaxID=658473 RepID=A0ABQ0LHL3_MYCCL|nr:predicted protein [Mycena chlorophos]
MPARKGAAHLDTKAHKTSLRNLESARAELQMRRNDERQAQEEEAIAVRNAHIRATRALPGPVHDPGNRLVVQPSLAEIEMWQAYNDHGADFSAGEIHSEQEAAERREHERLLEDLDIFGILDPDGTAGRLGFGQDGLQVEDVMEAVDEDDFMAEIDANTGEESNSGSLCINSDSISQSRNHGFRIRILSVSIIQERTGFDDVLIDTYVSRFG